MQRYKGHTISEEFAGIGKPARYLVTRLSACGTVGMSLLGTYDTEAEAKHAIDYPPIKPAHMTHFVAIMSVLGEDLASEYRRAIRGLEREAIRDLAAMSIPDALSYVRCALGVQS